MNALRIFKGYRTLEAANDALVARLEAAEILAEHYEARAEELEAALGEIEVEIVPEAEESPAPAARSAEEAGSESAA